jgi:hypothetical protein
MRTGGTPCIAWALLTLSEGDGGGTRHFQSAFSRQRVVKWKARHSLKFPRELTSGRRNLIGVCGKVLRPEHFASIRGLQSNAAGIRILPFARVAEMPNHNAAEIAEGTADLTHWDSRIMGRYDDLMVREVEARVTVVWQARRDYECNDCQSHG